MLPERQGLLVGLMRGVLESTQYWDMWCEPAAEAVRLLVGHEDPAVSDAATRVWDRYDRERIDVLERRKKTTSNGG